MARENVYTVRMLLRDTKDGPYREVIGEIKIVDSVVVSVLGRSRPDYTKISTLSRGLFVWVRSIRDYTINDEDFVARFMLSDAGIPFDFPRYPHYSWLTNELDPDTRSLYDTAAAVYELRGRNMKKTQRLGEDFKEQLQEATLKAAAIDDACEYMPDCD